MLDKGWGHFLVIEVHYLLWTLISFEKCQSVLLRHHGIIVTVQEETRRLLVTVLNNLNLVQVNLTQELDLAYDLGPNLLEHGLIETDGFCLQLAD